MDEVEQDLRGLRPALVSVEVNQSLLFFVHQVCSAQMFQIRKLDAYKNPINVLRDYIV